MQSGSRQAVSALDSVKRGTDAANTSTVRFQANLDRTVTFTGSVLGLSGAVATTAIAARDANSAIVALGAAQIFREIGNVVKDFGELAEGSEQIAEGAVRAANNMDRLGGATVTVGSAATRTTSRMSRLWGILAANPLGIVVGALGAISTAFILFSDNAGDAADSLDELVTKLDDLDARRSVARTFSRDDIIQADAGQRTSALFDAAVGIFQANQPVDARRLGGILGQSPEQLAESIIRSQLGDSVVAFQSLFDPNRRQSDFNSQVLQQQLSGLQGISFSDRDRRLNEQALVGGRFRIPDLLATGQFNLSPDAAINLLRDRSRQIAGPSAEEQSTITETVTADIVDNTQTALDNLQQMNVFAEQFGATLADSTLALVERTATAREILASIIRDFARAGLQRGFSSLINQAGNALGPVFNGSPSTIGGSGFNG